MKKRFDDVRLISPSFEFKNGYLELLEEQHQAGEDFFQSALAQKDFATFIEELNSQSKGINLPPGIVPMSTFWLIDSSQMILGRSVVRHFLTPALEHHGGHIGYVIRSSRRRQGYGALILSLTLEKARALGLARVRITCDTDNIGSVKVIEKNNGVLSATTISEQTGKLISQYWIGL
jgi:predicted acetyltransferase